MWLLAGSPVRRQGLSRALWLINRHQCLTLYPGAPPWFMLCPRAPRRLTCPGAIPVGRWLLLSSQGHPSWPMAVLLATGLHPGSVAGMGTPSTSRKSGATSVASHVPLHPPLVRGVASSALQKPVSGGLIQDGHESLGPRKSFRATHDVPFPQMPDSSVAGTGPAHQEQKDAPRSSQEVPKHSTGAPLALAPTVYTGEVAQRMVFPRLNPGVRSVPLGYEPSPSGSRRPLFITRSRRRCLGIPLAPWLLQTVTGHP